MMASARAGDPRYVTCLLSILLIADCEAKGDTCSPDDPVLVWPLGFNSGVSEIINNASEGVEGKVTYVDIPQDDNMAISSATVFSGDNMSHIISHVPLNTAFLEDYTIQFYAYFEDIVSGTILSYDSEVQTVSTDVQRFQIFVQTGSIVIDVPQYGSVEYAVNIKPQEWHHIMYQRDFSRDEVLLYINRTALKEKTVKDLHDKTTIAPGTLYIGVNLNFSSYFTGRLACLQIIPCKSTTSLLYDNYCINVSNTNTLSLGNATTAFTTGLPSSTTVSDTFIPSSTSTPLVTRSSTLSSISYAVNTPTINPLQSEMHPLRLSSIPARRFDVWTKCVHFTVKSQHTAFSSSTDVLDTTVVTDIASCARHCNKFNDCFAFTIQSTPAGIMCNIGKDQANLIAQEVFSSTKNLTLLTGFTQHRQEKFSYISSSRRIKSITL